MKIDLTGLFNGSVDSLDIDYKLDLSNLIYGTYYPIKDDITISGSVYSKADVIHLNLNISYSFYGVCDRCAEDVKKDFTIGIDRVIVEELQNEEEDDDYIVVGGRQLDIDELVSEEVSLSFPTKLLCKEDCKGLCQKCGANLNVEKCDCKPDVDPRMAALLQLLDEEE